MFNIKNIKNWSDTLLKEDNNDSDKLTDVKHVERKWRMKARREEEDRRKAEAVIKVVEVLWFVSWPMVSFSFHSIVVLISYLVCVPMTGYIVCFFLTLLTLFLLNYDSMPFSLTIRRSNTLLLIFA